MKNIRTSVITLCLTVFSAHAIVDGEAYGDWKGVCATSSEGVQICALEQELKDEKAQSVARISIMRSKSGEVIANVKVPLMVNLQAGLGLGVDGALLSQTKFISCDPEGCISLVPLDEERQNRLKQGNTLNIGVYVADKEVNVSASLIGVTKGLSSL